MKPDDTGIRYRGHSASDYMEGFNYELDAADRAGYSCGCFIAAIKIVGLSFRFISSSLGSIGYAITPSFFSRKSIEDKSSEETSGSGATGGAFGGKEAISIERYERLNLSRFKNRAGSYDSKAAIEYLYSTKLSDGEPILYPMPDNIVGGIKGIENGNNSCTIASLLFNMFGATSFFDELLLAGPETDKTAKDIRFQLIEIANDLRAGDRKVTAEKLINLRNLVMGRGSDFLQPDEFLDPLFKKLKINAENEFTFLDMREKETSGMDAIIEQIVSDHSEKIRPLEDVVNMQDFMEREDQIRNNYETAIASITSLSNPEASEYFIAKYTEYLLRPENLKPDCHSVRDFIDMVIEKCTTLSKNKINSEENKVIFIQPPRQGYHAAKAYSKITPSLYIPVGRQRYKFQSVVANEHNVHNASWVIFPKEGVDKGYYYNGGGGGVGTPRIEEKEEIYQLLFGDKRIEDVSSELQRSYKKLLEEGAFYIYIRE